jgi:hypothetical protein
VFSGALPSEALPEDGRIHFTISREHVKKAIKDSRPEESNWPHIHLLWDLHPVMEWLNFKLMVAFGRKQAAAMLLAGALAAGESLFLIQGEIPNRKGQPVIFARAHAAGCGAFAAHSILDLRSCSWPGARSAFV